VQGAKRGAMAHRRAPFAFLAAVLAIGLAGCGGDGEPAARVDPALAPVDRLQGKLIERSRTLPSGLVDWDIDWRLCWRAYPEAVHYELRTLTSEGASPKLRRHDSTCRTISVAGKASKPSERAKDRLVLLGFQKGAVAYMVRAVLPDGRRTPWSPAAPAATEGPIAAP